MPLWTWLDARSATLLDVKEDEFRAKIFVYYFLFFSSVCIKSFIKLIIDAKPVIQIPGFGPLGYIKRTYENSNKAQISSRKFLTHFFGC